ncbi:nuclear receptor corepressor 2 [Ceratobasidium sp. AG-Ba]|nr:nuclear receptor corepressor 2 [Ceratobasidium sp. AG-Ba]
MSGKNNSPLLTGSLGRAASLQMQRTPSHESLTTHPLLSPPATQLEQDPQPASRYVPYTPRHRAQPSASVPTPATSTSPQPTISISNSTSNPSFQASASSAGVTGRLQLQNLKAEAQTIGIGHDSVGWAILEKLGSSTLIPDTERAEWDEIWNLIIKGQATLLLPAETAPGNLVIDPEFMRDHLGLCHPPCQTTTPVVTASGIRGVLESSTLTFRSLMNVASVSFKPLLSIATRANALASLPPLPIPLAPSPNPAYPSVQVLSQTSSLSLLPRPLQPPPLPARPGTAGSPQQTRAPNPPVPSATSRLNPFASLFGSSRNTPAPTPPPLANVTPAPLVLPNDAGSARSSIDLSTSEGPVVAAYAIDRRISRATIAKEATRAIKGEIKAVLSTSGIPSWVKDRVTSFVNPLLPVPKASRRLSGGANQTLRPDMSSPQAASDSVQHFFGSMEEELFAYFGAGGRRKEDPSVDEKTAADAKREDNEEKDRRMREVMEKVERVVCTLFYERFFRPSTSDDASHDDALSSQIASLNMLDLRMGHLGLDVPPAAEKGVEDVIKQCGKELQRLGNIDCRSPAEKAAVFVNSNRLIAEGLSRLPPLRLKSENEMAEEKTPTASTFKEPAPTTSPQPAPEIVMSPDSDPSVLPPEPYAPLLDPLSAPGSPAQSARQLLPGQQSKNTSPSAAPGTILPADVEAASPSPAPSIVVQPTAVSSDILLPVMIYTVVKTNPSQLVSHLLYVQRFRSRSVGGEESFCLINLMAVVEFLENVDLAVLGLASSEKVLSVADLTPIPLAEAVESAASASHHPLDIIAASIKLRGKVNQVGEMAGSAAGKVLLGVMDTSMLALKGLLSGAEANSEGANQRQGFGLLRRGSGFSIASVAASLPAVGRGTPRSAPDEIPQDGQQLIDVSSRPGSLRGDSDESSDETGSTNESSDEESGDEQQASEDEGTRGGDTRSIRSFSSMLSRGSKDERKDRPSLQDRLANMSTLSRYSKSPPGGGLRKPSPPPTKRTSLLVANPFASPTSTAPEVQASSPVTTALTAPRLQIPPPNTRFLECAVDDLKLSEVAELLADYRRVVAGMQALNGFTA